MKSKLLQKKSYGRNQSREVVDDRRIQRLTGTSATCAKAARIAALVVSTNPSLTGQELSKILLETASPISDKGLGAGRLHAAPAVMKAKVPSKK